MRKIKEVKFIYLKDGIEARMEFENGDRVRVTGHHDKVPVTLPMVIKSIIRYLENLE
jgi:hypothetical protein